MVRMNQDQEEPSGVGIAFAAINSQLMCFPRRKFEEYIVQKQIYTIPHLKIVSTVFCYCLY